MIFFLKMSSLKNRFLQLVEAPFSHFQSKAQLVCKGDYIWKEREITDQIHREVLKSSPLESSKIFYFFNTLKLRNMSNGVSQGKKSASYDCSRICL